MEKATLYIKTLDFIVDEEESGNNEGPKLLAISTKPIKCPEDGQIYCKGYIESMEENDACYGKLVTKDDTGCDDIIEKNWASITVAKVTVSGKNAGKVTSRINEVKEIIEKQLLGYDYWDEEKSPDFTRTIRKVIRNTIEIAVELVARRAGVENPRINIETCTYDVIQYTC